MPRIESVWTTRLRTFGPLGAAGVTLWVINTFPPNDPLWRYIAYWGVVPAVWFLASIPWLRSKFINRDRVLIAVSCAFLLLGLLALYHYRPRPSAIAKLPSTAVQSAPAPAQPAQSLPSAADLAKEVAKLIPTPPPRNIHHVSVGDDVKTTDKATPTSTLLEMYFTNPENVEWRIKNSSSKAVDDVLYWFGLVDLDQPNLTPSPIVSSAPFNPLPIPVQKIDFINPGDTGGALVLPIDLMNRIKTGDRIFGTASFSFPNGTEKDYWLFFRYKQAGWYAPVGHSIKGMSIPVGDVAAGTNGSLDSLVPVGSRIEIKPEH